MLRSKRSTTDIPRIRLRLAGDDGTAALEFVTAGLILLVPLVYLILAVASVQAGALAVEGAARQAARVFVQAPTPDEAAARAARAIDFSLADYGIEPRGGIRHRFVQRSLHRKLPGTRRDRDGHRPAGCSPPARARRARPVGSGQRSGAGDRATAGVAVLGGRMTRMLRRAQNEDGSTLILAIFYGMLSLLLILLVTAATSLYLERKRLYSLADAAALVGAEAFELSSVSIDGGEPTLTLRSPQVRESVSAFLDANPVGTFQQLVLEDAVSHDGKSATVTVSSAWQPPVLTLFVPDGIRLEVTAVARSVFR